LALKIEQNWEENSDQNCLDEHNLFKELNFMKPIGRYRLAGLCVVLLGVLMAFAACTPRNNETPETVPVFPGFENGSGKLAFGAQINEDAMYDLYLIHLRDGELFRITEKANADIAPSLAMDGLTIAFSSDRRETYDLYTIALPNGEAEYVFLSSANETEPKFSPDGQAIVFQSNAFGDYDIFSIAPGDPEPER